MDKYIVHQTVEAKIRSRITDLQFALNDAMEATSDDSKSTAGDKHETSRAMAHLEQEKLGNQYSEALKLLEVLRRIDPSINTNTIRMGSLAETSMGWFYLSVGLGQIVIDGKTVFCLTPLAPFGQILIGKKSGELIQWQGREVKVLYVH